MDNGTSSGAPGIDFDGNPRPSGQGYDIGAYEYQTIPDVGENYFYSNPKKYVLFQNYPNPFNPTTTIRFDIPERSFTSLKIYNVLAKEVVELIEEEKTPGSYQVKFDASNLSSGVYFYKLQAVPTGRQAGSFVETKKMILIK